nr:hypothetical protein [uncultured Prevotella sp.]
MIKNTFYRSEMIVSKCNTNAPYDCCPLSTLWQLMLRTIRAKPPHHVCWIGISQELNTKLWIRNSLA